MQEHRTRSEELREQRGKELLRRGEGLLRCEKACAAQRRSGSEVLSSGAEENRP